MIYRSFLKRLIDLVCSILLFILLLPVFIVVIIICTLTYHGKPFFIQFRAGMNERLFPMIKFKTMRDSYDVLGNPLPDHQRLNRIGKILRRTSIDELPQLINVLKGEMSFIGPRPLLPNYLPWYTPTEKKRHLVKPGITGLAQINGRNTLSWDERLAFDVTYVEQISLKLDILIVFKTIYNLLFSSDSKTDPRSVLSDFDDVRSRKFQIVVNDKIKLRKPVPNDAPQILEVKNNREAAALLENENHGYTLIDIKKWINFHLTEKKNLVFVITYGTSDFIIGHAGLYDIELTEGICDYGILIGLTNYWHKGVGLAVTTKMLEIAFRELQLKSVYLNVLERNVRAVELYQKIGFKTIGQKSILRNNQPGLLFRMVITNNEMQF